MATLGDSQSLFADKPWTVWEELIESQPRNDEKPVVSEVPVAKSDSASDSMKLRKEDMYLFGLCPSQDEFYLVVCDRCGQVVKPQALETHLEQRHGNIPTKKSPTTVSPSTIASKTSSSPATTSTVARSSQPSTPSSPRPSPGASPKLTKPMAPITKLTSTEISSLSSKDMHKIKRNHSMPVVKVERISTPLAMKKGRVSLPPEKAPPDLKRKRISSTTSNSTHGVTPPNVTMSTSVPSPCPTTTVMTTSITTFALTTTTTTSRIRTPSPAAVSPPSLHLSASPAVAVHSPSPAPRTPTPVLARTPPPPPVSIPPPTPTPPPAVSACVPSPISLPPKLVPVNIPSPPVRVATQPTRRLPKEKPPKERKLLLCKDREFDADKHCGAWIQDISRQCTRSLTCKTHALSLRRAVAGRSKSFDELLKEHRAAKEALLKRKALAAQAVKKAASGGHIAEDLPKPVASRSAPALNGASSQKALAQALMAPTPLTPLKLAKPTNRIPNSLIQRPAFSPPAQPIIQKEPTPPPELSSHLSSEGEEDDFPYESPYLTYHPRPAAMCTYGGRLSGNCYTFNRKQDLLRAAFSHAVERHLHPPPHKKLCVESRLPQELHMPVESKDPYDFNVFDMTSCFGGSPPGGTPNPNALNKPKQASPTKLVSPPGTPTQTTMPMNRTMKPRDSPSGAKSPVQAAGPKVPFTSAKRKRSGSSQEPTNIVSSAETTYSGATNAFSSPAATPISINIPSGINLGTVGSINAALQAANKNCILTKNDVLKDMPGLVVTGIDATIANGQLINISSASLADITQLQNSIHIQNSAAIDKQVNQGAKVKMKTNSTKLKTANKTQNLHDIRTANNIFGLPSGTFIMESTTQPGTLIATQAPLTTLANSNSAANITAMSPPSHPSPSTTPSPLYRSGSLSPHVSATSPLPNGVVSSSSAVSLKGLSMGANHVPVTIAVNPANRNMPSPSRTNPGQGSPNHTGQFKITGKNHGGQNAVRHNPMFNKTSTNSAKAQSTHLSGTINVSHPGRLVTAASLQQHRFANQMLVSQTNPLVKSNSSSRASKSATQVPLLTAGNIVMTQQSLQSDERTRRELQQCIKTEPSDMIS